MKQLIQIQWKIFIIAFLVIILMPIANYISQLISNIRTDDPSTLNRICDLIDFGILPIVCCLSAILTEKSWEFLDILRKAPVVSGLARLIIPPWFFLDLSGKWEGKLTSQWNGTPDLVKVVEAKISQSWSCVSIRLTTDEMFGTSTGTLLNYDKENNTLKIRYFYTTIPHTKFCQENPPQTRGSAIATIDLDKPNEISIQYTNERGSGGDITLKRAQAPKHSK